MSTRMMNMKDADDGFFW